jgi:hypothetical protein
MDISSLLIPSLISGGIAYLTTTWLNRNKRQDEISCLKKALKAELQTLVSLYYPRKVPPTPPQNGDEIKAASLYSNYTTVYSKNANKLGMMNKETAESVVIAYTHIAALMDTLRVYGRTWENRIANQRHGNMQWDSYYQLDVNICHSFAYAEQEETLRAVEKAIQQLSK